MPPPLIHLHIPKNAGTTLSRLIKLKLGFWPPSHLLRHQQVLGYYSLNHQRRMRKLSALTPAQARRVRFVEAHAGYGIHEHLAVPAEYVTLLRDPIDRTLSVHAYQRQHNRIAPDLSIDDWIETDDHQRIWHVDNAQVRYLAGERGAIVDVARGQVTPMMLDVAIERLNEHFALVGVTEAFDASVILLRRLMGWKHCRYGTSNVTRQRRRMEDLPEATLDRLREVNELDLRLHDYARQRLDERIAAEGPGFQRELEALRADQAQYGARRANRFRILGVGRKFRRRLLNRISRA